jgi:hypothetical protein
MAKTWVLDTETKGTGAHMAPLERPRSGAAKEPELALVKLERPPRQVEQPPPTEPLRFKVLDVLSGRVLGEDIDVREVVSLLGEMRSVIDARIWMRSPQTGRWRLLGLEQQKALWGFRGRAQAAE